MATTKGLYTTNRTYVASLRGTYPYIQTYITDPFFRYTSLLLSGDTPAIPFNADASTNKFNITVFGDTKAANFSPYTSGYYSNSFDASSPVLIAASSTAYSFGTGDFLIETYGYARSWPSTWRIFSSPSATILDLYGSGNGSLQYNSGAGGTDATTTLLLNQWFHLAITRQSGVLRIFLDGVLKYTIANSNNYTTATEGYIGGYAGYSQSWDGFLSNFRVIKGAFPSLYQTSSVTVGATIFTVPTAPLTAVTNTSFLTCQENRFVDNSPNNSAITRNGDVSIKSFNPFLTPSAVAVNNFYSTNFDGSGDYLNTPSNAAFGFGTGDFTIEGWFYFTGTIGTYQRPWWFGDDNDGIEINSSVLRVGGASQGTLITGGTTILAHTWYHIALVRANGIYRLWLNGTQQGSTATNSYNSSARTFTLMATSSGVQPSAGTVSNLRIVKGTALYTGDFTPSTTPLTAITNTSLLTCQSPTLIDNSTNAFALTSAGQAQPIPVSPFTQTTTSVSTTYLGSSYLDGTGDYLSIPANSAFTFGTNDHTIEFYYYLPSTSLASGYSTQWKYSSASTQQATNDYYFQIGTAGGSNVGLLLGGGGSWGVLIQNSVSINVFVGVWTHIAWTRSGNTFRLFVNGVQVGTATYAGSISAQSNPMLLGQEGAGSYAGGYYSDFRVTNGTALYKANFAPPTAPLTSVSNTQLLTLQNSQPHNNSTFLDSSSNKFLITRNGNSTQGAFTPYGGNWSVYAPATGSYLTTSNNIFNISSTTAVWTYESWVMPLTNNTFFCIGSGGSYGNSIYIGWSTNKFTVGAGSGAGFNPVTFETTNTYPAGAWYHVAVTRTSAGVYTLYINGVADGTQTYNAGTLAAGTTVVINGVADNNGLGNSGGSFYNSNMRFLVGTVLYTGNFTVPTAPLTAITNTALLTCQSNRFIDNSTNNFTITRAGDIAAQRFSPFSPSDIYSANTIGGSAYFDGTGDWIQTSTTSTAFNLGAGDFTAECWVYPTGGDLIYGRTLMGNSPDSSVNGWSLDIQRTTGTHGILFVFSNSIIISSGATGVTVNAWNHIALVRSGSGTNNLKIYLNGTSVAQATFTSTDSTNYAFWVAGYSVAGSSIVQGYVSNARYVKGTAVYTSAFTPPTAPVTAVANTQLLCNFTNAGIIDNATMVNLESFGDAKITTANSRVGGSAMYFDGNGDYLTAPSTAIFAFGTGAYTIEAWVYVTSRSTEGSIWATGSQNNNLLITTGGLLRLYNGTSYTGTTVIALNTWAHVAVVRTSTATNGTQLFVNGVSDLVFTDTTNQTSATTGIIGVNNTGSNQYFPGYIDDLRVTKGFARYTGNFTPINSSHPLR
jgi:hypothetical protein